MENCDDSLSSMKNLGVASINILNAIGIKTRGDLARLGSVRTYLKIRARGIRVSKSMLYALEAAVLDIDWKELDPAIKQKLLEEIQQQESEIS